MQRLPATAVALLAVLAVLAAPTTPAAGATAAPPADFRVALWGAPMSYILGSQSWLYEPGNGTLALAEGADSSLVVSLAGQGHTWAFDFLAPGKRRLSSGDYGTTSWDMNELSPFARVRITRDGLAMGVPTRLEVRRLRRAPDGTVRSLWVRLVIPDPFGGAATDSADIRVEADTALFARVPGDVRGPAGGPFHVEARAVAPDAATASFALLAGPPGATLTDRGDGTAAIDLPASAFPGGDATLELRCATTAGAADTATVTLHALPPARLRISSSPADPLTWGAQVDIDERSASFAVESGPSWRARTKVAGMFEPWTLTFDGAGSDTLGPGSYPGAGQSYDGGWTDGTPRMRVQWGTTVCASPFPASFDVRKLRRAPDGSVRALWVTFAQSCGGAPPLTGELVWNADTALWVRAPRTLRAEAGGPVPLVATAIDTRGAAIDFSASLAPAGASVVDHHDGTASLAWPGGPPTPGTFVVTWIATSSDGHADTTVTTITAVRPALFVLDSPAGDPLGLTDTHLRLGGADGIESSTFTTDGWALVNFTGAEHALELRFAGPAWGPLRAGVFTGAKLFGTTQRDEPGLGVNLDSRACVLDSAAFHVRRLAYGPGGELQSLWVTFTQRCAGATTLTTGEIRVGADTLLYIEAPAELTRHPGEAVAFDVRAVDTRGLPVTLSALELPAGAVFTPGGGASGRVDWDCTDTVGAVRRFVFAAASADGACDTVVTWLRTFSRDRWRMASASGDYIGQGKTYDLRHPAGDFWTRRTGSTLQLEWHGMRESWALDLVMPFGRAPATGSYAHAASTTEHLSVAPAMYVSVTGRAGSPKQCAFQVRKLSFDSAGQVRTLWATFESSLNTGPGLAGELCLGSPDTTEWLEGPADVYVDPGQPDSLTLTAHGTLAVAPVWSLFAAPPGATLVPLAGGRARVTWPGLAQPGHYAVRVVAVAGDVADTLVSWVHVAGPAWVRIDADYPWSSQGLHRTFRDHDAVFKLRHNPNHAITVELDSPGVHGHWHFSRTDGSRLAPGSYPITDWPPPYGSSPNGLYFVWNGTVQCSRDARFDITDVTYSATDSLLSFAATLVYNNCNPLNPLAAEFHFPGAGAWTAVHAPPRAPAALDLQRVGANPGGAPLAFTLTAARPGPAVLHLLDVAGRMLVQRRWDSLPAGGALVTLGEVGALPPGCYFARFTSGGETVSRSVIVLR